MSLINNIITFLIGPTDGDGTFGEWAGEEVPGEAETPDKNKPEPEKPPYPANYYYLMEDEEDA
ncbi:MAG: hypothetical protein ACRCZS_19290 [Chroococcidiopsis sp.]